MKTKREVLEQFAKCGNCNGIKCTECPYYKPCEHCPNDDFGLKRIGAMAILRMFKKKKKPLLPVGTKIKFSDGKIATLVKIELDYTDIYYRLDFGSYYKSIDYLVDKTWDFVE